MNPNKKLEKFRFSFVIRVKYVFGKRSRIKLEFKFYLNDVALPSALRSILALQKTWLGSVYQWICSDLNRTIQLFTS